MTPLVAYEKRLLPDSTADLLAELLRAYEGLDTVPRAALSHEYAVLALYALASQIAQLYMLAGAAELAGEWGSRAAYWRRAPVDSLIARTGRAGDE